MPKTMSWIIAATLIVATASFAPLRAEDLDGDGFVKVLVPIAFSASQQLPGAQGSLWTTEVWINNASTIGIALQPGSDCQWPPCAGALPGDFERVPSVISNHNDGGALFYLPKDHAAAIHLDVRLLELSRRAQPTGVEIPLIREGDFLSGEAVLLSVPSGSGVRSALRVYDAGLLRGSSVRAEFLDMSGNVLATTILRPGDDPVVPERQYYAHPYPGADAIHNLTAVFPQLRSVEVFHVRLTPLTAGMQYWGFVSVTHDETQHVLLITPN
jgi:hypothetical protein